MFVEAEMKNIKMNKEANYRIIKQIYGEKQSIKEMFTFKIKTFHDILFSALKIIFEKKSLISSCIGIVEIPFKDLYKEGYKTYSIYSGIFDQDYPSYPYEEKEVVGELEIKFTISNEEFEDHHKETNPSFLDKIFHGIFNVERGTKVSIILAKMIAFTKGSNGFYYNATKGFYFLLDYYSGKEKRFSYSKICDFLSSLQKDEKKSTSFINKTNFSFVEEPKNNLQLFENSFYKKYKEFLYFAISPYGNSIITRFVKRRRKIEKKVETKHFLELLNIDEEDLLIYNLEGKDYNPIFLGFLHKEALVLSFRGTFSIRELSSDLKFEYKEFYNGFGHEGILELAEGFVINFYEKVKKILGGKRKLIITGHSLGGSLASVVGYILLKENLIKEEDLEVISFSAAPVFSRNIVEEKMFSNFVTFTFSNDSVPFLSYGSLCDLRYLCNSLGQKLHLFRKNPDETLDTIQKIKDHLIQSDLHPKLYIPGKIFQFKEYYDDNKGNLDKIFDILRKKKEETKVYLCKEYDFTFCNEIILDVNSGLHHIPHYLMDVFESCIALNDLLETNEEN